MIEPLNAETITRTWRTFLLYLLAIAGAEVVTSYLDPSYGLVLHVILLISLLGLSSFNYGGTPGSRLFLSLSLAPLIRIISLSLPLTAFPRSLWYVVSSIPTLIATWTMMRVEGLKFKDVGITTQKPLLQIGLAFTGIPFGVVEYFLLKPEPLATGLSIGEFSVLAGALILSTGLVEELVFRGVMQHTALHTLGTWGLLGITLVFASLHIGWLSLVDVIFVFTIGLFFSYVTYKTGSIVGSSLSHGLANVMLFLVMPSIV